MENPIVKPDIPYKGKIPGGLVAGRMCRLQGVSHPDADRFNINFQTGARPSDDTALHISVRHNQGYIARNTYIDEEWGEEMGEGPMPIGHAESWEIIVLVDEDDYKIAINGEHFTEFPHRVPFSRVTDLLIDGEVTITLISWEGIMGLGVAESAKKASQVDTQAGTQWAPQGGYGAPQGGYFPPQGYGGYGPAPGYGAPPQGYGPPPPPGATSESGFEGFLNGAQSMLSGAIKSGAAGLLLGKLLGGGSDTQRGYAHNNAKYGIYPDLPQDMNLNLNQGQNRQPQGPVEKLLSGLLAGGAAQQQPGTGAPRTQQGQVDYSALLTNLLSGHQQSKASQAHGAPQGAGTQQGQGEIGNFLSGLLSSHNQQPGGQLPPGSQPQGGGGMGTFLSGLLSNHNQQAGGQGPPGSQTHGVDVSGLLSNLLSGTATRPIQETGTHSSGTHPNTGGMQSQGDMSSLLSQLLSGGSQQPYGTAGQQGPGAAGHQGPGAAGHQGPGTQQSHGIDLNSLLSSLLASSDGNYQPGGFQSQPGGQQGHQSGGNNPPTSNYPSGGSNPPAGNNPPSGGYPPYGGSTPYSCFPGSRPTPPPPSAPSAGVGQPYSGPTEGPHPQSGGTSYGGGQMGGTQSTNSSGGIQRPPNASKGAETDFEDVTDELEKEMARQGHRQYSAQAERQRGEGEEQYGYYPHPPEQQQRGPIENLLSGLLSGGQQQQQQSHIPQFGGGESIGGLGSMSGILQNFAGQILHPRDGNQRQNY